MYPSYDSAASPTYGAQAPVPMPPKSNIGWAVASVVFFWPLAFSAFTHANNVYPLWASGDHAGAQYAADRARRLGMISLIVWVVLCVLFVIFYVVLIAAAINSGVDASTSTYSSYTVPTTTRGR